MTSKTLASLLAVVFATQLAMPALAAEPRATAHESAESRTLKVNPSDERIGATDKSITEVEPSQAGLEAFINAIILVEGLKRASKDLTRTGFIRALEHMGNLDLGTGRRYALRYTESNHNALTSEDIEILQMKDGAPTALTASDWSELLPRK